MGEGIAYRRSKTLRCFAEAEPYADTTLESPLNGRRRCTDATYPNLSGQRTEKAYAGLYVAFILSLTFTGVLARYPGFLFT